MVKRIITTIIGVAILVAVMLIDNIILFNCAVAAISIIALYEFYNALSKKDVHPLKYLGYISCALMIPIGVVNNNIMLIILSMFIPLVLLVCYVKSISDNVKTNIIDISVTVMGILYVGLFVFLIFTKQMNHGNYYVWYIFGGAWMTDTFAYLVGSRFGKHKFSKISKNKSIEGSIGGMLGSAIFFVIYSWYLNSLNIDGITLNIAIMGIIGIIISAISQIGDIAASSIKRFCDIKDYGTIMPGHGGILDRFDSILFVSPFIYLLFNLI